MDEKAFVRLAWYRNRSLGLRQKRLGALVECPADPETIVGEITTAVTVDGEIGMAKI
jgi:hypothetical protein